ncbi:hypothetical protein ACFL56_02425 [Candidatus Margulisiibacteriota bacterium]
MVSKIDFVPRVILLKGGYVSKNKEADTVGEEEAVVEEKECTCCCEDRATEMLERWIEVEHGLILMIHNYNDEYIDDENYEMEYEREYAEDNQFFSINLYDLYYDRNNSEHDPIFYLFVNELLDYFEEECYDMPLTVVVAGTHINITVYPEEVRGLVITGAERYMEGRANY